MPANRYIDHTQKCVEVVRGFDDQSSRVRFLVENCLRCNDFEGCSLEDQINSKTVDHIVSGIGKIF